MKYNSIESLYCRVVELEEQVRDLQNLSEEKRIGAKEIPVFKRGFDGLKDKEAISKLDKSELVHCLYEIAFEITCLNIEIQSKETPCK